MIMTRKKRAEAGIMKEYLVIKALGNRSLRRS
jgi:hypothetical protein